MVIFNNILSNNFRAKKNSRKKSHKIFAQIICLKILGKLGIIWVIFAKFPQKTCILVPMYYLDLEIFTKDLHFSTQVLSCISAKNRTHPPALCLHFTPRTPPGCVETLVLYWYFTNCRIKLNYW